MARVDGPLMSMGASGSVAGTVVFSRWKGRPYVRQLVRPANPQTPNQISVRSIMRFLSQNWAAIDAPQKANWTDLAEQNKISPFNAYTKENMLAWRNFLPPSQIYPATRTAVTGTLDNWGATGGIRQVTIDWEWTSYANTWGILIFRSTSSSFTPGFSNLVQAVFSPEDNDSHTWIDTPLAAGTYYYNARPFSIDGLLGAAFGEESATVS